MVHGFIIHLLLYSMDAVQSVPTHGPTGTTYPSKPTVDLPYGRNGVSGPPGRVDTVVMGT